MKRKNCGSVSGSFARVRIRKKVGSVHLKKLFGSTSVSEHQDSNLRSRTVSGLASGTGTGSRGPGRGARSPHRSSPRTSSCTACSALQDNVYVVVVYHLAYVASWTYDNRLHSSHCRETMHIDLLLMNYLNF